MPISDRINNWVEDRRKEWGEDLGNFLLGAIGKGATKFAEDMEPGAIDGIKDTLIKVRDDPNTPEDLKAFIDKVITPGNPILVVLGVLMLVGMFTGTIGALFAPMNRATEYKVDRIMETFRLDPMSIITAWRRDPEKYAWLFDDLEEKGWSDAKIEALKFLTLVYPSRQDLIRYVAREALEPEAIEKYGLMDEFDRLDLTLFEQIGVPVETAKLDWIAHWEHASWMQVVEMLHRGLITEAEVWEWFRLVEIPPFWRQLLIDSAYTWPTRVDVRRWWDMRTIDETELRRLYSGMGYRGVNLDNYVLWTKVYTAFPDLIARWSKGWITLDEVRSELTGLGMPAERVEEMLQTKIKAAQPERLEEGKALTKTEIYKGVKQGLITWEEGIELLMDIDYDYEEADYILTINVGVLEGSPETFEEFKAITQKYKKATGREATAMPEELQKAAAELVERTKDVEALAAAIKKEEAKLIAEEPLPEEATERLDELRLKLHRAEAELSRLQTDYNIKVAEWRVTLL